MEKMGSKNYTDVLIAGKIYTLGGLEEESYLQQVASYLNDKIAGLQRQDGFRKQPEDYQNVMTYLNIADDYFKEREHAGLLAAQKEELEKETYRLKHELVSTQMKLEAIKVELEKYKTQEALENARSRDDKQEQKAE
ncbi:cell division protein ZapA [[Clostridium] symbiosum]|uniref:cell division protein ZapA n=1 Tax=Clostridium symbiosum TaxID=1512 RepID=UPI001D06C707|nr:cell division protein ZapA [[Clostridium] symbiosum]MCB6609409.1 cell division protein ZapA [[Clostridium] symbiosum]MCB6929219.1 cell division protein ZapA [[Clostridium] symbiosum]